MFNPVLLPIFWKDVLYMKWNNYANNIKIAKNTNFKNKQQYEHRYFSAPQNGSVSLQSVVTKHEWFQDQGGAHIRQVPILGSKSPLHVALKK